MAKKLFPEHELYLLNHWTDVVKFEASMNSVRERYKAILEKALRIVRNAHNNLDTQGMHLEYPPQYDLNVGIGKKVWPDLGKNWPSGFWIGSVRLENLILEDEDHPYASIYIVQKDSNREFLDDMANTIRHKAKDSLTGNQFGDLEICDTGDKQHQRLIWCPLAVSRSELLNLLLEDEAEEFVNRIAGYLESLTQFTSIMDDIFRVAKRSRT